MRVLPYICKHLHTLLLHVKAILLGVFRVGPLKSQLLLLVVIVIIVIVVLKAISKDIFQQLIIYISLVN